MSALIRKRVTLKGFCKVVSIQYYFEDSLFSAHTEPAEISGIKREMNAVIMEMMKKFADEDKTVVHRYDANFLNRLKNETPDKLVVIMTTLPLRLITKSLSGISLSFGRIDDMTARLFAIRPGGTLNSASVNSCHCRHMGDHRQPRQLILSGG